MICIDQRTAVMGKEPLFTLAKYRRENGRILFGIHLCLKPESTEENLGQIALGDSVVVHSFLPSVT